jgi:hypothetical protein
LLFLSNRSHLSYLSPSPFFFVNYEGFNSQFFCKQKLVHLSQFYLGCAFYFFGFDLICNPFFHVSCFQSSFVFFSHNRVVI